MKNRRTLLILTIVLLSIAGCDRQTEEGSTGSIRKGIGERAGARSTNSAPAPHPPAPTTVDSEQQPSDPTGCPEVEYADHLITFLERLLAEGTEEAVGRPDQQVHQR